MKVFISWSGENSKKLAEELRSWLPAVLQLVKPYFTPSDIDKGTRWNTEIAKELEASEVGILCVTRDNLHSDWVMFEAGALSKSLDKAHVCPVLFGIHNTDLAGPLQQFQTTEFVKDDVKKLVSVINAKLGESKLSAKVLDSVFEKWWPELEGPVNKILKELGEGDGEPLRSERNLLEEILQLSRAAVQPVVRPGPRISPKAAHDLVASYVALHDDQVAGKGGYQATLDALRSMKPAIDHILRRVPLPPPEHDEYTRRLDGLTFKAEEQEKPAAEDETNQPF